MKTEKQSGLESLTRRDFIRNMAICAALLCSSDLFAEQNITINRSFISPENEKRRNRDLTDLIVLHTSEGNFNGIYHLREKGMAHYFIDSKGGIFQVMEDEKVAHHAGTSIWSKRTHLNDYSIGIEIEGYHDKDINRRQYISLKRLLSNLKDRYGIKDDRILPHSMVAYGEPNTWHKKPHRGRKRCAMLLASQDARRNMGLSPSPGYDPDVRAGRLVVADPYLEKMIYGSAPSANVEQPPKSPNTKDRMPEIPKTEDTRTESLRKYLAETEVFRHHTVGVLDGDKRTPYSHAGKEWNSPSTYYLIGKKLHKSSEIDPRKLPRGTYILYKAR